MTDFVVIVPSRGRPEAALTLARVFADTCTAGTRPVFAVDADDPSREDYSEVVSLGLASVLTGNAHSMVEALNQRAVGYAGLEPHLMPFAIGFMGDDHCPRTVGWDAAYLDALYELGTGIVYGNDLLQGERIPTQVAMTSDIVRALGFMAPPTLTHLYVDNFWKDLGEKAECLRYLPEVVVEHRHPFAGKAQMDAGYLRVNEAAMYERDQTAYGLYVAEHLAGDVAKVKALRGDV